MRKILWFNSHVLIHSGSAITIESVNDHVAMISFAEETGHVVFAFDTMQNEPQGVHFRDSFQKD